MRETHDAPSSSLLRLTEPLKVELHVRRIQEDAEPYSLAWAIWMGAVGHVFPTSQNVRGPWGLDVIASKDVKRNRVLRGGVRGLRRTASPICPGRALMRYRKDDFNRQRSSGASSGQAQRPLTLHKGKQAANLAPVDDRCEPPAVRRRTSACLLPKQRSLSGADQWYWLRLRGTPIDISAVARNTTRMHWCLAKL